MQGVQKRKKEIETSDENALFGLSESVFCATIQIVPETLPRPIPKTIPIIKKVLETDDYKCRFKALYGLFWGTDYNVAAQE